MKLKNSGDIQRIKEYTGYSIQQIHRVLNGERGKTSLSARKILKAVEIMDSEEDRVKEKVLEALKEIENNFKPKI